MVAGLEKELAQELRLLQEAELSLFDEMGATNGSGVGAESVGLGQRERDSEGESRAGLLDTTNPFPEFVVQIRCLSVHRFVCLL